MVTPGIFRTTANVSNYHYFAIYAHSSFPKAIHIAVCCPVTSSSLSVESTTAPTDVPVAVLTPPQVVAPNDTPVVVPTDKPVVTPTNSPDAPPIETPTNPPDRISDATGCVLLQNNFYRSVASEPQFIEFMYEVETVQGPPIRWRILSVHSIWRRLSFDCRNITPILVHTTVPLRWTFEVQPSRF